MAKTLKGKIIEISTHFINCYCNSILRMNNAIVRMKTCIWDHCWTTTSCFCYWERVETSLSFCYWYKDEKHKTNLSFIFSNSLDISYIYNSRDMILDITTWLQCTLIFALSIRMPDQHFIILNKRTVFCNLYSVLYCLQL